ncbi:hypothetical protein HK405_006069 [Cladochytrium tenue]|nr:hypothetical protein HK405_006069 [Cladochytrium tenue]
MDYLRQGQKGQGRGPARSSTVSGPNYRSTPGSTPPNHARQSFGHDRVDGDGDAKDFRRVTSSASHRAEGSRANFGSLFRASRKKASNGSGELTPPPMSASPGGARRGSHDSVQSSDRGSDARSIGSTSRGAGGSMRSFVGGISRRLKQTFRHPDYFQDEGAWDGAQWSPAGSSTTAPHGDLAYHHYDGVSERDGPTLPLPPTTPQSRSHNSSDRTLAPLNDDEAIPADELFSVLYDTPHSKAFGAVGQQGFDLPPIPTSASLSNQPVPVIYVGPTSPPVLPLFSPQSPMGFSPLEQTVPDLLSETSTMPTLPRSSSRPHKRPEKEQLSVISPISPSFSFTTSPVSPNIDEFTGSATPPITFEPISLGPFTGPPTLPLPPPHDASFNLFNTEPAEKPSEQVDGKVADKLVSSRTSSAPSAPDMHADPQTPPFNTAPRTPTSFATLGRSLSVRSPKSTAAIQQVVQANVAQSAARAGGNVASASHLFWVPAHVSAVDEGIVGGDFKAWVGAAKAGRVASLPPGELSLEDVTPTSQFFDTDAKQPTDDASPSRRTTLSRTSSISRSKSFKDRHVVITPDNLDEVLRDFPGDVATGNGPVIAPHPAVAGLIASEARDELTPRGTGKSSPRGSLRRPSPIRARVTESPTDAAGPVLLMSESAPPAETKALPDLPSSPVAPLRSSSLARPRASGSPISSGPGLAATLMRQGSLIQLPAPSDPAALDVALDEALTQIKKDPASAVVLPPPEIDDEEARAVVYAAMEAIEAAAWVDATIIGSDSELAVGEPGLVSSEGVATMRRRKRRAVVGVGEGDGDGGEPLDQLSRRSSEDDGPASSERSRSWGSRSSSELFSRNALMTGAPPSPPSPATGARASTPPRPPPVPLPGRPVPDALDESDSESVYSDGSSVASGRASEDSGVFDPFADLRDLQASGGRRAASSGPESLTELTPVIIPSRTVPAATMAPQTNQELEALPSPSVRRPNKRASVRSLQSPSPSSGEDRPAEPSSARPLSSSSSWSWLAGWMPGGSSVKTKKGGSVASTDDGPTATATSPTPQGDASRPRTAAVGKRSRLFGGSMGGDAAAVESRSETRRRPGTASRSSVGADDDDDDGPLDGFPRFPLQVEKSIYRMSHVKLAQDRRPLLEQVEISNLMLFILSVHADVTLNRQGPRGRKKKKGKRNRKKGGQAQPTAPAGGGGAASAPVEDNVLEFSKTPGRSSRPAMPSAPLVDLSQPSTFGLDTGGGGGLRPQQMAPVQTLMSAPAPLMSAPAPSPVSPAPPLLLAPPPSQIPPGLPVRLPPVLPPGAVLGPPPPMAAFFSGGGPGPGPRGPVAGVAAAGGPPRLGIPGPPPLDLLMRGRPAPPPAGVLGIPGMPPVLLQPGLGAGPVPPPPPLASRGPVSPPAGYPLSPHLPDVALPPETDSDTGPAAPRGGGGRNMDLFLAVMGDDADSDGGSDGHRPQRTSGDGARKILPIGGGGGGRGAGKRASSRAGVGSGGGRAGRSFVAGSSAGARNGGGGGGGGGSGGADEDDVPLGMLQATRAR